ncbi:carboxyl transferase domain-containing protein [Hyphomonas sp. NPDC076900]|uniref:carboxyl transferase domain-containing protein n=1 Tax=unclassified Hyphomonas TaxID=2630699 RepID=UPI003D034B90
MPSTLKKILIANRGEIAIRIARTASDLGIETVAIHSPDDAQCLHVRHASEAVELKGTGVRAYLDIDQIVRIALETGCDGIHPGYGLLSERTDFVSACEASGLVFIGPGVGTMSMQGDKVAARALAVRSGVPIISGIDELKSAAAAKKFFRAAGGGPIMIKSVNGGGGRGMRIVHEESGVESAFAHCKAEALAAFGEDALYAEQYLPSVRHIEVQILGDGDDVIHLWERDCSIQRRNQKIIELAPAPHLDEEVRQSLLAAAVRIGKASGYKGLGTVEFLVDVGAHGNEGYYFIETNPRIQVEHTITEEITGLDLVELQLRIAGGETLRELGLDQATIGSPAGYAVQLRINAETVSEAGDIVPTGGVLSVFQPPGGPGVRVDTYGYTGYRTNPNFDSLLAKLIVHSRGGELRPVLEKACRALEEFHVSGFGTNISLLSGLLGSPEVREWSFSIRSIGELIRELSSDGAVLRKRFFADVASSQGEDRHEQEDFPEGAVPILAPIQALVTSIAVAEGDTYDVGDELAVIEAMKMQHEVRAATAGRILRVLVSAGEVVGAHQPVLLVEECEGTGTGGTEKSAVDPDYIRPDLSALRDRISLTLDEARPEAVERRRSRGQRTARENVADLCDPGSFVEYGQLVIAGQRRKRGVDDLVGSSPADGIVTGIGTVNGDKFGERARVAVLAYDATVMAGTQGIFGHKKSDRLIEVAHEQDLPVVYYTEGGGGRPNDDDFAHIVSSALNITTFNEFAKLHAPRIGVNSGFCFAGNAAIYGTCDIRIAARNSWIGLGGPAMVEAGGLGTFSPKELGPASVQAKNGLVDVLADDEVDATLKARQILSYFQGELDSGRAGDQRLLRHAIPENRKRVYDIRSVIRLIADEGSFLEIRRDFAAGLVAGFLRVGGRAMGLIANNPMHLGGAIDARASEKGADFFTLCGRFNLPVLSLCDTPGFMVGPESERDGGVRQACRFMAAGANIQTPIFFVCLRKGYGIGSQAMAGGSFAAPLFSIAWPTGEFGAMGLEGSVELGYKKELDAEPNFAARQILVDKLVQKAYEAGSALNVASLLEIDAVIDPKDTRDWILKGLHSSGR